jgi:putative ABC transport system ATP-binding protein
MSIIETRELTRTYRMGEVEVQALRGVSFTIEQGEFVAIMGPSGSGKSTLMNLMGCLDTPTSGEYCIAGLPTERLDKDQLAAVRNRAIGFVFQQFNLLPRSSALANVELPLIYRGERSAERRRKAAEHALQAVGLGERVRHRPNELSGGQQQRVAIARALVTQPHILLADEPTGNLDSQASAEIMALFKQLNQHGLTVIIVTHEPDVAAEARRVLTIRDGLLASDDRSVQKSA